MHVLLCNDDGIHAPGLSHLADALEGLGTLWIVAPDRERSAQSHALTMHEPLRAVEKGPRRWSVSGTPADCVYLALHHVLPEPPAIVVSGINHGSNLGSDVFYSGTVAAAMEACLHDRPAVAISFHPLEPETPWVWETARQVSRRVVEAALANGLPPRSLLNVNVPNVPLARLAGIRAATLGERRYHPLAELRRDPRGRAYFWIGGSHQGFGDADGSDGVLIQQRYATVTPFSADWTDHAMLPAVAGWLEG